MKLQIKDWNKHFENAKSRERDQCSFVCVPNKQDGMGLLRILSLEDGLAVYGVWQLILGMCSRQPKPRDGYLTDTGRVLGGYLTVNDLAMRWHRSPSEISRAIEVLTSDKVGWIIDLDKVPAQYPPGIRVVPAQYPLGTLEEKRREEKGNEEKEKNPLTPTGGSVAAVQAAVIDGIVPEADAETCPDPEASSVGFGRFWEAWPKHHRKVERAACVRTWKRAGCEVVTERVMDMLGHWKVSAEWAEQGGQFIPAPKVWLNKRKWEGEIPPPKNGERHGDRNGNRAASGKPRSSFDEVSLPRILSPSGEGGGGT